MEILLLWLIFAAVGTALGARKGAAVFGFLIGLLLGPIGWIIILVYRGNRIQCPSCRELIDPAATICPKCHSPRGIAQIPFHPAQALRPIPPVPQMAMIRVASNGQDLGTMSESMVRTMLSNGSLRQDDFFLDSALNEWRPLREHSMFLH